MTVCENHCHANSIKYSALFAYLSSGDINHIWLDNFVALLKRQNFDRMQEFLDKNCNNNTLYLHLYEGACLYQSSHERFYSVAKDHMKYQDTLRSILIIIGELVLKNEYDFNTGLHIIAIKNAMDSMEAQVERAGVQLCSILLDKNDKDVHLLIMTVIKERPERPSVTDFRRLCFILQVSLESGRFSQEVAPFACKLPKRSKYSDFKVESYVTVDDIIDEIELYSGKHVCAHECYHD